MEEGLKRPRGFAAMDKNALREVCSRGGKASQALGKAHRFTAETGRSAGRIGGLMMAGRPGHMAELGRRGGAALSKIPGRMAELGKRGGAAMRARAQAKVAQSVLGTKQ